jgi:transcriptional regulator with XRE-family HTH domain
MATSAAIVKRLRTRTGLVQKEFAERVGLTQPQVSKYEKGRIKPPLAVLMRFYKRFPAEFKAIGVSRDRLIRVGLREQAER